MLVPFSGEVIMNTAMTRGDPMAHCSDHSRLTACSPHRWPWDVMTTTRPRCPEILGRPVRVPTRCILLLVTARRRGFLHCGGAISTKAKGSFPARSSTTRTTGSLMSWRQRSRIACNPVRTFHLLRQLRRLAVSSSGYARPQAPRPRHPWPETTPSAREDTHGTRQ